VLFFGQLIPFSAIVLKKYAVFTRTAPGSSRRRHSCGSNKRIFLRAAAATGAAKCVTNVWWEKRTFVTKKFSFNMNEDELFNIDILSYAFSLLDTDSKVWKFMT
jgi:hypothetical protein